MHKKLCVFLLASLFFAAFAVEKATASDANTQNELLHGVTAPSNRVASGSSAASLLDVGQDLEASIAQYVLYSTPFRACDALSILSTLSRTSSSTVFAARRSSRALLS